MWTEWLSQTKRLLRKRLLNYSGFHDLLDEGIQHEHSPFCAMQVAIRDFKLGTPGDGVAHHKLRITLDGSRHQLAEILFWSSALDGDEQEDFIDSMQQVSELFRDWWCAYPRSAKGDLPTFNEMTKRSCEALCRSQIAAGKVMSILFIDLDNFKQVNNKHQQSGGDKVILKVANFLEGCVSHRGILIHHGGDEFCVVLLNDRVDDAIALALDLLTQSETFNFGPEWNVGPDFRVGFSVGLASTGCCAAKDFESLLKAADGGALKVLVKGGDGSAKGSVRVYRDATIYAPWPEKPPMWEKGWLAASLRKDLTRNNHSAVFSNEWLNALLSIARDSIRSPIWIQEIGAKLIGAVKALKVPFAPVSCLTSVPEDQLNLQLSALDVALVFVRCIFERQLRWGTDSDSASIELLAFESGAQVLWGGTCVLSLGNATGSSIAVGLGYPPTRFEMKDGEEVDCAQFMVVEIGRNNLGVLPLLATDHVVVDDRPVRGGGLPDFWELAISRIMRTLARKPNIASVIVVHPSGEEFETVSRLMNTATWETTHYMYKCCATKELVEAARRRIERCCQVISDEGQASAIISGLYDTPVELKSTSAIDEPPVAGGIVRNLRQRRRSLDQHGCTVPTALLAYPMVLEILRKSDGDGGLPIRDQDGLELTELCDFRIMLTDPTRDTIPSYFWKEEAGFERYYSSQFRDRKGRFFCALNEDGAEGKVLDHAAWAVSRPGKGSFSTRRAIIVLSHKPGGNPEAMSPLGLVSVRLLPRPLTSGTIELNVSFTWRTVEALIGLPYSLFGSIRYAQHLRHELGVRIGMNVSLGFVSYVASSLHFFRGDECGQIARRIVNDSSE